MLLKYKVATYKLLTAFKHFFNELKGVHPYTGNKFHCPACNSNLKYFNGISFEYIKHLEDNAFVHPFFMLETSNISNYGCPHCRATDRDRLYALYIQRYLSERKNGTVLNILDFAPGPGLSGFLKRNKEINYRSADLYMKEADDKVDISDMHIYKDNSFDVFICSHVLEYVKNDKKAVGELYRVLKPGGWGIAMVPIMLSIEETFEDPSIVTEADQWKYNMQNGHLRLYSKKGFIQLFEEGGFIVNQLDASYFGMDTFVKHGVQERSVLYIVQVPETKK